MMNLKQQVERKTLPKLNKDLGQSILTFFLKNFDEEGYEPQTTFVPWAKRKYQVNTKLLNKTGYLRSQFRVEKDSDGQVVITNDADYAQYINDGTDDTPARPILYSSTELERDIEAMITRQISDLFKF